MRRREFLTLIGALSAIRGADWALPEAYARMLGLTSFRGSPDDTITLNTSYNWSYGQDVINTLEHEITEGAMGRVGGLGDQNGVWSTMDLFRYAAAGTPDYTDGRDGRTTYFSYNGGNTLSPQSFNNQFSGSTRVNGGDSADFAQLDVFGTGTPGETFGLSQTDIEVMDVLGWNPSGVGVASSGSGTSGSTGSSGSSAAIATGSQQLVNAMAAFVGGSGAFGGFTSAAAPNDALQQFTLADAHNRHA